MGQNSAIEWTHHTFNPWWGCVRVSPGCQHCYAETFAKRVGQKVWGVDAERRTFGDKHWNEPRRWNEAAAKAGERQRVFCASMADVFENRTDLDAQRERLWRLIESTPMLDWLLLTKRPENIAGMLPWTRRQGNLWLGTTVEDRKRAEERVRHLRMSRAVAAVLFLSMEPLLEDVSDVPLRGIDWIIIGGESGPGARPFSLEWARRLVHRGRTDGVAVHVKQLGADPFEPYSDGSRFSDVRLRDRKGGDWDEWSEDLRVREYPSPDSPPVEGA